VLASAPTVRELDLMDGSLCSDCAATVRHRQWPPDSVGTGGQRGDTADSGSPAGRHDSDETIASEQDPRASDDSTDPPGNQSTGDYLLQSLHHDVANTARFTGAIVGFGVAFVASLLLVLEVTGYLLGPFAEQSDQVAWLTIAISVGLGWYVYRRAKRLLSFVARTGAARVRATTDD